MTTQTSSRAYRHLKYVGNRPKDDQENLCRAKLSHIVRDVGCFYEIYPEKLYMVYLAKDEDTKTFCDKHSDDPNSPFIYWGMHQNPTLTYQAFYRDFGPFNLATTHQFCSLLKVWLDTQALREPDKIIVIVLADSDTKRKLNFTLLVAVAAMVLLDLTDDQVLEKLDFFMMYKPKPSESNKELVFREKKLFSDVSGSKMWLELNLEDCIRAFYAALQAKFYKYYEFDQTEYLFYETVMSGDLNWVIPDKLLAFAGPSDFSSKSIYDTKHPPEFYYPYFKDHNVSTIVRLNEPEYDSSSFKGAGFDHYDLIFPDGCPPSLAIATKFIKIVDEAKGAVAVHCYAGIGRTGTLIAAYLIARHNFSSQMSIAWTRICRPGSVIGLQQDWLLTNFDQIVSVGSKQKQSSKSRARRIKAGQSTDDLIQEDTRQTGDLKTTYETDEKTYGQAKALLLAKKLNEDRQDRPCTRNSSSTKSHDPVAERKEPQTKKTALLLDLGKTVPLMLHLSDLKDLKDGENPKFYRLKDNKYEWKVKFPEPGYVALRHNKQEITNAMKYDIQIDQVYSEPKLEFRFTEPDEFFKVTSEGVKIPTTLKPTAFFNLFWFEI